MPFILRWWSWTDGPEPEPEVATGSRIVHPVFVTNVSEVT